jgi:hypothetical protein
MSQRKQGLASGFPHLVVWGSSQKGVWEEMTQDNFPCSNISMGVTSLQLTHSLQESCLNRNPVSRQG